MPAVETGRFYALLLLLCAAMCFAYAFGRECGVAAASKEYDRMLREVSRSVVEQNTRLNAAGAFDAERPCDDPVPRARPAPPARVD
jgi:hypothetical protein